MHGISVNLTNYCDGKQLNYNNDLASIENKNNALQKPVKSYYFLITYGVCKNIKYYNLISEKKILSF